MPHTFEVTAAIAVVQSPLNESEDNRRLNELRLSVGEAAMSNSVEPCDIVPNCPVCASKLHVAHSHAKLKICVCRECGTSLSIPDDAWLRARMIRDNVKAE